MATLNNEDFARESRELPEPAARIASLTNHQGGKWYALEPLVSYPLKINARVYTADQMREAIAAERERSHELLQAADHIRAGLEAELAALLGAVDESERERDYLRWRMREIIPLFEEARDALCAISLVAATAYRVDLSLGSRMDAAGTRTREEFDAMRTAAEKEQPK